MRSIEMIYEKLLADFARRAGFTPEAGCDLAVRLWAAAAELQALETQAEWVLDQSFPQTAQGVFLDRHGAMRGLNTGASGQMALGLPGPGASCASLWRRRRSWTSPSRRGRCA